LAPPSSPSHHASTPASDDPPPFEPSGGELQDSVRRARRSSIDKAVADLEKENLTVRKLTAEIDDLPADECNKKDERKKASLRKRKAGHLAAARQLNERINNLRAEAAAASAMKAQREAAKRLKAENARAMTETGVVALVRLKLDYQTRFDDSSNKSDLVWAHIHADIKSKVEKGELPQSDLRSVDSLRAK